MGQDPARRKQCLGIIHDLSWIKKRRGIPANLEQARAMIRVVDKVSWTKRIVKFLIYLLTYIYIFDIISSIREVVMKTTYHIRQFRLGATPKWYGFISLAKAIATKKLLEGAGHKVYLFRNDSNGNSKRIG